MKYILVLSLLFPLSLMAMEQDKETYCGIVTQLINSVPRAGNGKHLSPISENTLIYKKILAGSGNKGSCMEFVTSIDDLNPPEISRLINTSAFQHNVYINKVAFMSSEQSVITFSVTSRENGVMDMGAQGFSNTQRIDLGCAYQVGVTDCALLGMSKAMFSKNTDGRLLKPSWGLRDGDIESTSRREDLEKCPSRTVYLMISYLRMNKISTESGDAYILSEKQGIE